MKRIVILGLVVAVLLVCVAVWTHTAEAQRHQGPPAPQPSSYYPVGTTQNITQPPASPVPGLDPTAPSFLQQVQADTVEELLTKLDAIKTKKAELDKVEKDTLAMLKERLKQQKQRLQNLGVPGEESTEPPLNSKSPEPIRFDPKPVR